MYYMWKVEFRNLIEKFNQMSYLLYQRALLSFNHMEELCHVNVKLIKDHKTLHLHLFFNSCWMSHMYHLMTWKIKSLIGLEISNSLVEVIKVWLPCKSVVCISKQLIRPLHFFFNTELQSFF